MSAARSPFLPSSTAIAQATETAIALKMLRENISLETIARITGLTIAHLQQVQLENQGQSHYDEGRSR